MLTNEETKALVMNRVRRSRETWTETKGIIEGGYWHAAANRMYYACYYKQYPEECKTDQKCTAFI